MYGAPPIPKSNLAMVSLVFSEWASDERPNEEKLNNPKFLDVAYTIIDLSGDTPVCGQTKRFRVKANAAMGQKDGYEINPLPSKGSKPGQVPPLSPTSSVSVFLLLLHLHFALHTS